MKEKNNGMISFEKLILNGPVVETYASIGTSIYENVYISAADLVARIVENNRNLSVSIKNGFEYEGSNVISFVGRRGVGKTSAMFSFSNILEEYTKSDVYADVRKLFDGKEFMKNVAFYSLDYIDASVMEESEDIFVLILANMFNKAMASGKNDSGRMREYDNRLLFQKFEEVYNNFMALNTKIKEYDEYAPFEKLENVGGGQRIRENFAELVQYFLKMIDNSRDIGQENIDRYLVIIIDDLDMAKRKREDRTYNWGSYKIMSTIYKYLMVPNVIILTAYNHEKLISECIGYNRDQEEGLENYRNRKGEIEQAALQFMEKIFPIFSRLYMPSWKKRDLQEEAGMKIEFKSNKISIPDFINLNLNDEVLSVKNFIFILLAQRTRIYFDIEGKKKHFFEPDTLRTLYNYTQLIMHLKVLTKESIYIDYKYNIKKIKEDCYFRFKEEKLMNIRENEMFDKWLEEPFQRRGPEIVKTVCRDINKLGKEYKVKYASYVRTVKLRNQKLAEVYPEVSDTLDNQNTVYSYAELVHGIYHMTRDNERYSKELVGCILYSYTIHLTEIYTKYRWFKRDITIKKYMTKYRRTKNVVRLSHNEKEILDKIDEYYLILKNMIGPTVCGKWSEYYFPDVRVYVSRTPSLNPKVYGPYILGYIDGIRTPFYVYSDENGEFNAEQIKRLLFVAMMHTEALKWTENNIKWENITQPGKDDDSKDQNPTENLAVGFRIEANQESDLDMTGFFKYTFCYAEFLGRIEKILLSSLETEFRMLKETSSEVDKKTVPEDKYNRIKESIQNIFEKIWEEYYQWDRLYGNMMLPLYSLDVTYNVIKRAFQECQTNPIGGIDIFDNTKISIVSTLFSGMLEKFRKHMHILDEEYRQTKETENFENAFVNCPVYKFIRSYEDQDKDWSDDILQQYLVNMVRSKMLDEGYMDAPEG